MPSKSLLLIACIALISAPYEGRGSSTHQDQVIVLENDVGTPLAPVCTITCTEREMEVLSYEVPEERLAWTPPVSGAPVETEMASPPAAEPCDRTVDPRPGW